MNDMSTFAKSAWTTDGTVIKAQVPITKVDSQRRIVSGFATLDNLDVQGDVVPAHVSRSAFERFRGNVREMHNPIAVGKVVSFRDEIFVDEKTGQSYNGIYVDVYVSKGAPSTWEKVLDQTLTGFSIGGVINEDEYVFDSAVNKEIRVIRNYDLAELSLVDNPANQLANILSIQKTADGTLNFNGIIAKTQTENVLWCESDAIIRLSQLDDNCPICSKQMKAIGFVESDDAEKTMAVKDMLNIFKKNMGLEPSAEAASENIEKEDKMAEEIEEVVEAPELDLAKAVSDISAINAAVAELAEMAKAVEGIAELSSAVTELTGIVKANADSTNSLQETLSSLRGDVESLKATTESFGKRVEAVEADTAVRKSGDLGEVAQVEQKQESIWGGRFLKADGLNR